MDVRGTNTGFFIEDRRKGRLSAVSLVARPTADGKVDVEASGGAKIGRTGRG